MCSVPAMRLLKHELRFGTAVAPMSSPMSSPMPSSMATTHDIRGSTVERVYSHEKEKCASVVASAVCLCSETVSRDGLLLHRNPIDVFEPAD